MWSEPYCEADVLYLRCSFALEHDVSNQLFIPSLATVATKNSYGVCYEQTTSFAVLLFMHSSNIT